MSKIYWNKNHKKLFVEYVKLLDNYKFMSLDVLNRHAYEFNLKDYIIDVDFIKKYCKINNIVDKTLFFMPYDVVNIINEYTDVCITVKCQVLLTEEGQKMIMFIFIESDAVYKYYMSSINFNKPYNYLIKYSDKNLCVSSMTKESYAVHYLNFFGEYMLKYYNKYISVFSQGEEHFVFNKRHDWNVYGGNKFVHTIQIKNHKLFKNMCIILQMLISTTMKNIHNDI